MASNISTSNATNDTNISNISTSNATNNTDTSNISTPNATNNTDTSNISNATNDTNTSNISTSNATNDTDTSNISTSNTTNISTSNTTNNSNIRTAINDGSEWNEHTIRLLINQRKHRNREYYQIIGRSRTSYWESIARRINREAGSNFTGRQCNRKFNNLVSHYYVSKFLSI